MDQGFHLKEAEQPLFHQHFGLKARRCVPLYTFEVLGNKKASSQ